MIDQAIQAHQDWVERFKNCLHSPECEMASLNKAGDYEACPLGTWMGEESSYDALSRDMYTEISLKHIMFHCLAEEIVQMLSEHADEREIQTKITELKTFSRNLTKLLIEAKRRFQTS